MASPSCAFRQEVYFWPILVALTLPEVILLTPLFVTLQKLRMYNAFFSVVFPQTALQMPFTILLTINFLDGVPNELMEAARIDEIIKVIVITDDLERTAWAYRTLLGVDHASEPENLPHNTTRTPASPLSSSRRRATRSTNTSIPPNRWVRCLKSGRDTDIILSREGA